MLAICKVRGRGLLLADDYSTVKRLLNWASRACAPGTAELRLHSVQPCAGVSSSGTGTGSAPAAPPRSASLSARIKMFEQQAAAASAAGGGKAAAGAAAGREAAAGEQLTGGAGGKQQSKGGKQQQNIGPHESCITAVVPLPDNSGDRCLTFLTASLEGCVAEWRVDPATL